MKKILRQSLRSPLKIMSIVSGLIVAIFLLTSSPSQVTPVYAAGNFADWAWSSNIGWINLNGGSYGVAMNESTGVLSGYGWSDNVGWISFNSESVANCNERGIASSAANCQAKVNLSTGQVSGAARACSVFASGCSGDIKKGGVDGSILGGWDGYIALSGSTFNVSKPNKNKLAGGLAWGSDVLGWIEFMTAGDGPSVEVIADESIDPKTGPKTGEEKFAPTIGYRASETPTSCNAEGSWKNKLITAKVQTSYQLQDDLSAGQYTYTLTCTFSNGMTASDSTTVTVTAKEEDKKAPTVSLAANPTEGIVKKINPRLTWTTTNDPDKCVAGGKWSGNKATAGGRQDVGTINREGSYTYTMYCENEFGRSATASVTVNVRETQCNDKKDNDGDGKVDALDPGCHEDDDINKPYHAEYDNEDNDENSGTSEPGADQCLNIPGVQKSPIMPPYRKLTDGSNKCLCIAGYVLNAEYKCVKPIYTEH